MAARLLAQVEAPAWDTRALVHPPADLAAARDWLEREAFPQAPGDLGAKLTAAFADAFAAGAPAAIAIGSDCLGVDRTLLARAFARLESADAVLAPARDGGYTLLGLARPLPEVFRAIPWSSPDTCAVTRRRLATVGARWSELEMMDDIDTPEDFREAVARWPELARFLPPGA